MKWLARGQEPLKQNTLQHFDAASDICDQCFLGVCLSLPKYPHLKRVY